MIAKEELIPRIGVVIDIHAYTPDIKTFRIVGLDGKKMFDHVPGQCAMISIPGVGESMISITSSPTMQDYMEFSIKNVGCVSGFMHQIEVGQQVLVRGPYGNGFPVDGEFRGKDLLFVGGGVGLAPLRGIINYCRDQRQNFGHIDLVYGSRSKDDLLYLDEIQNEWANTPDMNVYLTIDREQEGWDGHVGFVPNYVTELAFTPGRTAIMCGPPALLHFTLQALEKLGFEKRQVFATMEMRMKCGIGKCGRCNIGDKFACKDGPVFTLDQLSKLPDEF